MADVSKAPEELLKEVKAYLDITWEDEATDRKISGLILSGMSYLTGKIGGSPDYTTPGEPLTLLREYVRYGRDAALDVFENNYLSRIVAAQNERKVSVYGGKAAVEGAEPAGE